MPGLPPRHPRPKPGLLTASFALPPRSASPLWLSPPVSAFSAFSVVQFPLSSLSRPFRPALGRVPDAPQSVTDVLECFQDIREPSQDVREPSQDVRELSQDVLEPSQDVREPSQDVLEAFQDVLEPSQDVREHSQDVPHRSWEPREPPWPRQISCADERGSPQDDVPARG